CKTVLEIGCDQFLVLLLVVEAEPNDGRKLGLVLVARALDQLEYGLVDCGAVATDLGDIGTRDQAALRARVLLANAVVVGVEKVAPGRVDGAPVRVVRLEHEGLEKPGGMGTVPFDRAGAGHRLKRLIFWRQRRGKAFGGRANGFEISAELR